jgi:hypothetical protein
MDDMIFPDNNLTDFPISVKSNLMKLAKNYSKKDFLKYHQFIIYHYLIKNHNSRGLLLFHEMGMGKSITAAALAEFYRKHDPSRKIIVLLSKSLQDNFKKNIVKFISEIKDESIKDGSKLSPNEIDVIIREKYKFVSLNASNMYTQMTNVNKTTDELILEKQLKEFSEIVENDDFLENSLLIIDEFHNVSNSITNGSYNAIRLYDTIMKTKNIKLLFLSGTPIINNPFELVPTFNMLNGLISTEFSKMGNSDTLIPLFPELKKDFDIYFVDGIKNKIKNADKFKNRIFGLVSYYGDMYFGNRTKENFPKLFTIKVEFVCMSSSQYFAYNMAREFEMDESSSKGKNIVKAERFSSKGSESSSYRVKSRQISNYLIPEYALGPVRGKKARQKFVDKIKTDDLKNMSVYSPKFKKIIDNIKLHKDQLGLIYSEFVSGEGIAIFARILDSIGYKSWNSNQIDADSINAFDITLSKKSKDTNHKYPVYATITGDVSFEDRTKLINIFNSDKNINGRKILLLLISKTGAEGLDLKNVRHVHLIEPYWNYARLSQIIARAARFKSHDSLPLKERTVTPYIYLSDYPKDIIEKKKKTMTTDVQLYTDSVKNKKLINEFFIALAESSIDCSLHSENFTKDISDRIKCKLCSPNNVKLYNPILAKQIILPNPCQELKESEIKVKSITISGSDEKFMYNKTSDNNFHIYKFDKNINGYTILDSSYPLYPDIMIKLLKLSKL